MRICSTRRMANTEDSTSIEGEDGQSEIPFEILIGMFPFDGFQRFASIFCIDH